MEWMELNYGTTSFHFTLPPERLRSIIKVEPWLYGIPKDMCKTRLILMPESASVLVTETFEEVMKLIEG